MEVRRCAYCGEFFKARPGRRFCSWACYSKERVQDACKPKPIQKKETVAAACQFNEGVICYPAGECSNCGWNPAVAERRLASILAQLLGCEEVLNNASG